MKAIRHGRSNVFYHGSPLEEVPDLWVERPSPGEVHVVFEFEEYERAMIADGAQVELVLYHEPIPLLSAGVVPAGVYEKIEE
jgi:hypothetical protein